MNLAINGGKHFFTEDHPVKTNNGWRAANADMARELSDHLDLDVTLLTVGDIIIGHNGDEIEVKVYAVFVPDVAGIHAQIQYDANKVDILSVTSGEFFKRSQKPIFVFDDDEEGILDIYTFFMSNEMTTEGIGGIASIDVRLKSPGESELKITTKSELLDPEDTEIPIKGFGKGIINAK